MAWIRAIWKEAGEETEGVVQESWVDEAAGVVYWPVGVSQYRAVKMKLKPSEKWLRYELVRVKFRSNDKQLCEDYNFTENSLAESCSENLNDKEKQSGTKNKRRDFESESSDDAEMEEIIGKRKRVKKTKHLRKDFDSASFESDDEAPPDNNIKGKQKNTPKIALFPKPSLVTPATQMFDTSINFSSSTPSRQAASASNDSGNGTCSSSEGHMGKIKRNQHSNCNLYPMSAEKFQRKVIQGLSDILDAINSLGNRVEPEDSHFRIERLTSIRNFEENEESLKNNESRMVAVRQISRIGGADLKDNVRKVMRRLMDNVLMSEFNLNGNRGKRSFKNTNLFQVVVAGIMKSQNTTETAVALCVADTLKRAPERHRMSKAVEAQ